MIIIDTRAEAARGVPVIDQALAYIVSNFPKRVLKAWGHDYGGRSEAETTAKRAHMYIRCSHLVKNFRSINICNLRPLVGSMSINCSYRKIIPDTIDVVELSERCDVGDSSLMRSLGTVFGRAKTLTTITPASQR